MNSENLRSIGGITPPTAKPDGAESMNTFAVNRFGDVALIDAAGRIKFTALRGEADHVIHELPIDNLDLLASCKFTNIEFNDDGTILLLWSDKVRSCYCLIALKLCVSQRLIFETK